MTHTNRLLSFVFTLFIISNTANAHFTLQSPVSSREKVAFPNDDRRYWPIAGDSVLRPIRNCLDFPRSRTVANFQAGTSVTLGYEVGGGARHIGLCTAELINISTGQTQPIGEEQDCVSRRDAITVTLPPTACPNCVIKVKVTAVHRGIDFIELYDSCMDVNISTTVPTTPTTTTQTTSSVQPMAQPTPTLISPLVCSETGRLECADNGTAFRACEVSGFFVTRPMPPGTKCISLGPQGGITIALA